MTKEEKSGTELIGQVCPGSPRETLLDVAVRKKEVLVAKSVVEEVRKKVLWFRGDPKGGKEKVDAKMEETARAAAWAWYQHGNGGKECISTGGKSADNSGIFSVRAGRLSGRSLHRFSRFKTEALKGFHIDGCAGEDPTQNWDCSPGSTPTTTTTTTTSFFDSSLSSTPPRSSLFDSYELDIVSKRIDSAFQVEMISPAVAWVMPPASKLGKSSSLRFQIPGNLSGSRGDHLNGEEMATGIDTRKCECDKNKAVRRSGWSFRRSSRASQVSMHLPECEHHPQLQGPQRLAASEQCQEHEHDHEHEHHHHIHYQVRLRDGMSHGNPLRKFPGHQK